jgi:hypothetical protein
VATVPDKGDSRRRRLPECMRCVLDHLAAGLPPGPRSLLSLYGRHAHDGGCGIYPGLRALSKELHTSPVTLRAWRDELVARGLLQRLPRKGPHGADLFRLGPCDHCQRDSIQLRCADCQRDNLQHAETEWWAAQRDSMQSQKAVVQGEPTGTPVSSRRRPAAGSPNDHAHLCEGRSAPSRSLGSEASASEAAYSRRRASTTASIAGHQGTTAAQATAGAVIPFQARSADAGAPGGAVRTQSRDPPGDTTGDPCTHPSDGRLFEMEPARTREHWR